MKVGKFSARSSQQIEGAKYVKKNGDLATFFNVFVRDCKGE